MAKDGIQARQIGRVICWLLFFLFVRPDRLYPVECSFPQAVKTAERTRELAVASGQDELVDDIEKHIKLYKLDRPWRQGVNE